MKSDIIKKSKQIAIPNNKQRKKVDKIANQVFSLVNRDSKTTDLRLHYLSNYCQ